MWIPNRRFWVSWARVQLSPNLIAKSLDMSENKNKNRVILHFSKLKNNNKLLEQSIRFWMPFQCTSGNICLKTQKEKQHYECVKIDRFVRFDDVEIDTRTSSTSTTCALLRTRSRYLHTTKREREKKTKVVKRMWLCWIERSGAVYRRNEKRFDTNTRIVDFLFLNTHTTQLNTSFETKNSVFDLQRIQDRWRKRCRRS